MCSIVTIVKYLYKYVYKGHDRSTIQLQDTNGVIDEINSYLDEWYISPSEGCWRIFAYDMHYEKPDIQRLKVQQNNVLFKDHEDFRDVVSRDRNTKTTLTEWFVTNGMHEDANQSSNQLLYINFPTKWVWNQGSKS